MFRRIVVPLDGSELAERGLAQAEDLARVADVPIRIVRVVDVGKLATHSPLGFGVAPTALQLALDDEERFAREYLERVVQEVIARGVDASSEMRFGVAEREIVALTQSDDLIVMATHGRGGVSRWFMGSVAEEIARRSPVPVMLVRSIPVETIVGRDSAAGRETRNVVTVPAGA
jgi:nucleotide-binding universal stress UspA family protein